MDLNSIIESDTGTYQLKHPVDGAPLGVTFTLAGPEHPVRHKITMQAARDMRRRVQKAGKLVLEDPEDEHEQETGYLVACTLDWRDLEIAGKAVAFSPTEARSLYTNPKFAWVRRQIRKALDDAEVFTVSSPKV